MSTRRTKLNAAETQQVIGINEAGQAQKLGSEEDCKTTDFCRKNSELPTHIVIDILSRVSIKTLLNLRLVCKDWLSLISEPYFAYLHLSKSRPSLLFASYDPSPKLNLVDLPISPSSSYDDRKVLITTINLPKRPNIGYIIINSCNGLLCLIDPDRGAQVCVCNPLLGELVTLPNCPSGGYIGRGSCAFGFSPKTTQYKVIRSILSYEPETGKRTYAAEIYTLGEGSWRSMGTVPTMVYNFSFNAFLHGSIHWFSRAGGVDFIYSFDFGSEQFLVVPEPSEEFCSKYIYLGVLQGCLSICEMRETGQVKVWVMKDYGVKESWSKDFVIESHLLLVRDNIFSCEPIMVLEDGQKLLIGRSNNCFRVFNISSKCPRRNMQTFQCNSCYLIGVFDIGSKCLRDARTFQRSSTYCIAHVPSLLSLRDVAKGECFEKLSCMKETGSSSCKLRWLIKGFCWCFKS